MFHYQDRDGAEIDLVLETTDNRVIAVEVKAGQTAKREWFRWLERVRHKLGRDFVLGLALYAGDQVLSFGDRLMAVPISALWEL